MFLFNQVILRGEGTSTYLAKLPHSLHVSILIVEPTEILLVHYFEYTPAVNAVEYSLIFVCLRWPQTIRSTASVVQSKTMNDMDLRNVTHRSSLFTIYSSALYISHNSNKETADVGASIYEI